MKALLSRPGPIHTRCSNENPHGVHWPDWPNHCCPGVPQIEDDVRCEAWKQGHGIACTGSDEDGGWCGHLNPYRSA